jgi:predicted PurR-regulated permease PerM
VVIAVTVLLILLVPVIVQEVAYFIESFPLYMRELHTLATDPSRPWLSTIIGEGLAHAERSLGELTTLVSDWFVTFLRSAWSGGRALISILSLGVVAPIVAFYLLNDWDRMIAAIDNWVPPAQRETVRVLAREVDDTIRGFVRGQSALCLSLAVFYAAVLWLIGLKHGALIGLTAGLLSFIPYLGSLSGLLIATSVAVAQFWPNWGSILLVPGYLPRRTIAGRLRALTLSGRASHSFDSCVGNFRSVRLRVFVRIRRALDCSAACCRDRCAHAFRTATLLRESTL